MLHQLLRQFLLDRGLQKKTQKIYKNPPKEKIIQVLKQYKQEKTQENFEKLIKILKL